MKGRQVESMQWRSPCHTHPANHSLVGVTLIHPRPLLHHPHLPPPLPAMGTQGTGIPARSCQLISSQASGIPHTPAGLCQAARLGVLLPSLVRLSLSRSTTSTQTSLLPLTALPATPHIQHLWFLLTLAPSAHHLIHTCCPPPRQHLALPRLQSALWLLPLPPTPQDLVRAPICPPPACHS